MGDIRQVVISTRRHLVVRARKSDEPAVARSGLSVELHPNAFIGALCALNSITGDPGLLISNICTSDPSIENVDI